MLKKIALVFLVFLLLFISNLLGRPSFAETGNNADPLTYLIIEKAPVVVQADEKAPVTSPVPGLRHDTIEQNEKITEPVERPL